MKRYNSSHMKQKLILFILLWLTLSGCIEIEENIHIREDLSGHVEYQIKMSELGSLFSGISGFLDEKLQAKINEEADKLVQKLKIQPGITNVVYETTKSNNKYSVRFDFDKARNFNHALYAMGDARKTIFTPGYLRVNRCRVKKINFSTYLALYLKREKIEIPDHYLTDMVTFKSTIKVPDEIKKVKGLSATVTMDRHAVEQEIPFRKIIHERTDTGMKIRY